jgi:hypothetical protein
MTRMHRTLLAAALCFLTASPLVAQRAVDPSGHWEGTLQASLMEVPFAIDFARNEQGELAGTVSLPAERIAGLPLLKVAVDGTTISFYARSDQPMSGTLSADGKTITGDYSVAGNTVPFTMTRSGDAKIDPPVTSAAISAALEGTWNATIAANGTQAHVVLTLANRAGGRSIGNLVNLDQGGIRLPLAIEENGTAVTLTSTAVASSFSGTLNAAGDLAGTFTQSSLSVPVTFRRAAAAAK